MKVAKQLVRNPDGTKTLHRPYRIAVDQHGNEHHLPNSTQSAAIGGRVLPAGWRWKPSPGPTPGRGVRKRPA